jgi:trans-aconitate 2-methyltransferase
MNLTTKSFDPIRDDYAFFEEHATEAEEDVRAYAPLVRAQVAGEGPIQMLDFGCAGGRFTSRFLDMANITPGRLQLKLVEPGEENRAQATEKLQARSSSTIQAMSKLTPDAGPFDLVLANHVLYYVEQLDQQLAAVVQALAPRGLLLAAMAGQDNTLIQFWNRAFAMIGQPVPFHTAEDVQAALDARGVPFRKQTVNYQLVFADNPANRTHILRFLFGDWFHKMPPAELLAMFDPFVAEDTISMRLVHEHIIVGGR